MLVRELLARRMPQGARAWWEGELSALDAGRFDESSFLATFTAASRRAGKQPLALSGDELSRIREAKIEQRLEAWSNDDLARALLLQAALQKLPGEKHVALVKRAYDDGDNNERRAVLRSLALLPDPARHLALAIDACRTAVQPIFEAIACENIYPARWFPELNFNQMALKAAFNEVALSRIVLLSTRKTKELDRMARDYAGEREAAGRSVPADLGLLLLG